MDRMRQTWRVYKHNGGFIRSFVQLFRQDVLKEGTLIGEDAYGNKYYQNDKYTFGRNRWVEYADHVWLDYDASHVPAEWFGWLHYRTDLPPHMEPFRPKYPWMAPHTELQTGNSEQYVPYSTRPKIEAWQPPRQTHAKLRVCADNGSVRRDDSLC